MSFTSYESWYRKTAWTRALYHRARRICSTPDKFKQQLTKIKQFLSWYGYPKRVASTLIHRFKLAEVQREANVAKKNIKPKQNKDDKLIWLRLPYAGRDGKAICKRLIRKLKRCLNTNVQFKILYETKKLSSIVSSKDPVPTGQKSHVIYKFTCPGCGHDYIGKTDGCLMNMALKQIPPCINISAVVKRSNFNSPS